MPIHGYPGGVITANPVAPTSTVATGVWTTEQQLQATSAGNWPRPGPPQPISRSLRFNSADSTYLNRTPASTGNQKTWTWSSWIKRSILGTDQGIFNPVTGGDGSNENQFKFQAADTIQVYDSGATRGNFITTQVFRDVSAWYHIVVALDTTQATSTNRFKLYVNGVQVTAFSTASYPSQNTDWGWNRTVRHDIGRYAFGATQYFNGYMAEINFIDGQQLTPSSFGQTNAATGVWEPLAYTGTYGTNGFYLNFSDNSGTTSTTLGKDYSGNGNNWTPNNFSVTAGAGNDSMVDSPTSYGTDTGVGGEVRSNYCTLNPLSTTANLADGNLNYSSGTKFAAGTIFQTSGKFYAECVASGTFSAQGIAWGFSSGNANMPSSATPGVAGLNGTWYVYSGGGLLGSWIDTAYGSNYSNPFTVGQTWQFAVDVDNGKAWLGQNNTWYDSSFGTTGNPSTGANPTFTISSPTTRNGFNILCGNNTAGGTFTFNFGQRAFAYTAPSGFKALCTQNLPTPTIGATSTTQANDYFNVSIWTGNNASRNITNSGSMQPDFVWIKDRSRVSSNDLVDAVRGVNKALISDSTFSEYTGSFVSSFNSDGFSLPANGLGDNFYTNISGDAFVGWQWKANGAGSSNTAGSITSTVSANTTSGFSIVTYTGTGSAATIGHGLGVAPSMIITKARSQTSAWGVYHASLGATKFLRLETTNAEATSSSLWNDTAPTSTLFSIRDSSATNDLNQTYVAYCFAPVAGYSAFGSYTGNGSTDGPFVYLGFRPAFVLIKNISIVQSWNIYDDQRPPYNTITQRLLANSSNAEETRPSTDVTDFTSNGFKVRSDTTIINGNGNTHIYMAFAEFPFKFSLAR